MIYTVNGKGYANYRGKHYEIGRGDVLFIDCYDYHEYYTDKSDLWEIKWVHFAGCGSEGYFNLIYDRCGPVIKVGEDSALPVFIDELMVMMKTGERQFEVKASCLIMRILTELMLAGAGDMEGECRPAYYEQVEAAVGLIKESFRSEITLSDLAAAAGSSKYHLVRIFKRVTGYSPYEYLIKYRINRAKNLLSTTFKPVGEIAENVGFKSASNFIKTFKKNEGITPLKYRRFWMGE